MSNYPTMDAESCDANGMNGNCGPDCPAYLAGNCPIPEDIGEEDLWKGEGAE